MPPVYMAGGILLCIKAKRLEAVYGQARHQFIRVLSCSLLLHTAKQHVFECVIHYLFLYYSCYCTGDLIGCKTLYPLHFTLYE